MSMNTQGENVMSRIINKMIKCHALTWLRSVANLNSSSIMKNTRTKKMVS
jgi:hypothetical protein